jgi:hypothetical protein
MICLTSDPKPYTAPSEVTALSEVSSVWFRPLPPALKLLMSLSDQWRFANITEKRYG